jgi:pimeloyl-ACP methyl ester carboxylesterase
LINVDGIDAFVRFTPPSTDDAEPAMYVHGLGGSSSNWTDLAALLSHRLDAVAIDLPGFGRSGPARRYTVGAMAARVIRLIEHADLWSGRRTGPIHLVGNSMGGAVAVRIAGTRPDLVRSLTLISPAMPFLDPRRSVQGRLVPLAFLPVAIRIARRRLAAFEPADLSRMVINTCFADPNRYPAQRRAEAVEEVAFRAELPWYADAYVRSLRGLVGSFLRAYLPGENSLWRVAGRITAPTLVLAGERDRLVDVRVSPQVARAIPDSRLLMLDDVGHVAQMEVPVTVARAVLAFLDELAGSRA